jgi:hypothetical protein
LLIITNCLFISFLNPLSSATFLYIRELYWQLRGHWRNVIVLNVHVPTEDKIDDTVACRHTAK